MNRDTKLSVATLMIASFMIGTDFTGALILVPPIESEYAVDITTTQWVLNIYALTFAMLIVAGGRLGDMYGRRRLMLIGLAIFIAASLGCLFAPSIGWLIGARAAQGVGGAFLWPSILALGATLVKEDERGLVMGLILAGITIGNVIGPLISGIVVSLGDWRLFFLVNAVIGIVVAFPVLRILPKEPPGQANDRIDYAGMVILSGAILALLYGLDVSADWGWDSLPLLGLFAISLVLFVAFPFIEKSVANPTVPPQLMRNREFILTLSTNALVVPSLFIAFLYFPQYLQKVMGWSVLQASVGILPLMVLLAVGSLVAGHFYKTYGPKRLLFSGYVLVALGAASVVALVPSWGYFAIVPAMLLIGFGGAITVSSAGTAAISAVAPSRAGLAGGLTFMFHLGFGAIGVAGATAIMYASSLASLKQGFAQAGITMSSANQRALNAGGADTDAVRAVLGHYSPETIDKIQAVMVNSFSTGMSDAYWLAFVAAVAGVFVVIAIDEKKLQSVDN